MSYCSRTDLKNRLSEVGVAFVADDDADSESSNAELVASSDKAISAADAEIDTALTPHGFTLPLTVSNTWLNQRAIDIGAEHMAERGGGGVPASLAAAAKRSRDWLDDVRKGDLRVPYLTYPADGNQEERRRLGVPRSANPCCKRGRCR